MLNFYKHTLVFVVLCSYRLTSAVYISEVINNTEQAVSFAFQPKQGGGNIITCKSMVTGESLLPDTEASSRNTNLIFPSKTISRLEGVIIPDGSNDSKGYLRAGITIGFGRGIKPISLNNIEGEYGTFTLIRTRKNKIEAIYKDKFRWFADDNFIPISPTLNEQKYILEIDGPDKLVIVPSTEEKLKTYLNPGNLQPQELLNQAIVNNSVEDLRAAIALGANVDLGVGNQPPLLLAIIMDKERVARELLEQGANPSIQYAGKPLVFHIIRKNNYKLAQEYLMKKPNLTEAEKKEIIAYIMSGPYRFDQLAIDILKMLGYDIKDSFNSTDLSANKWYQLLVKHNMGTRQGKPFGHTGLPGLDLVTLFLKNGANPNQIFKDAEDKSWTPLLLLMDNYIAMDRKQCGQGLMNDLIKTLLDAGANLELSSIPEKKEASPLSYLLKYDDSNCIIDLLVKFGANIASAIQLYLDAGGSANKSFRFWQKKGSWNLLLWAVEHNDPEAVKLLVQAGTYKDQAALKLAITKGYSDIISILMP